MRAEYFLEVEEWENLRAEAKENKLKNLKKGEKTSSLQNQGVTEEIPDFPNSENRGINTTKDLSEKINVGTDTASRIIQIREKATPEQKARLRSGEASVNEIYKELRNEKDKDFKISMYEKLRENMIPELFGELHRQV